MIRITKIAAAGFIGTIGLLFFLDNLFNLDAAYTGVSFVLSGAEQPYYKILGPTISASWLTWLALATIMAGELGTGVLGLWGALKLAQKKSAPAEDFNSAKTTAIAAGALGMLVWYGFFVAIGEGYFHMWQSQVGLASAEGAFRYGTVCAVLMFYLTIRDD